MRCKLHIELSIYEYAAYLSAMLLSSKKEIGLLRRGMKLAELGAVEPPYGEASFGVDLELSRQDEARLAALGGTDSARALFAAGVRSYLIAECFRRRKEGIAIKAAA